MGPHLHLETTVSRQQTASSLHRPRTLLSPAVLGRHVFAGLARVIARVCSPRFRGRLGRERRQVNTSYVELLLKENLVRTLTTQTDKISLPTSLKGGPGLVPAGQEGG